jgi:hypothetical protein
MSAAQVANLLHMAGVFRGMTRILLALAATLLMAAPAHAATDGTSNTLMTGEFGLAPVASVKPGATPHQAVVTLANAPAGLAPGKHFDRVTFTSPRLTIILENTMISGLTADHIAFNFMNVEFVNRGCFMDYTDDACVGLALGSQFGEED